MKKILFLSMVATLILASKSFAQQNALVAVLTHEGTNTTFHGAGALAEANEAAVDGDVITLSGGTFNEVTVSKGITIRGAGMYRNDSTDVDRTQISKLTIADSTENVAIENLYIPTLTTGKALVHVNFFKVLVPTIDVNDGSNMSFVNCKITSRLNCNDVSILSLMNSLVYKPYINTNDVVANFQNCVVVFSSWGSGNGSSYADGVRYTSFMNCILCTYNSEPTYSSASDAYRHTRLPSTATVINNLGFGNALFEYITNTTNKAISNTSENTANIFLNLESNDFYRQYSDSYNFELTDEAKATYLGSDGMEVGLYGGIYPFNSKPHHPIITKSNVARKAEDGKLNVSFEVNGND